jgi:hypothetical protein
MATIKMLHENSALELPGRRMDRGIDLGNGDKRASIEQVSLPPGDDGKGRLRGFHPILRKVPHPQFGIKSRLFALIDEGEDVSGGLWEGLENMLSTESAEGSRLITIVSGANPKKRESPFAQRATPPGGWENFDLETMEEWDGPESLGKWRVIRIDNAKSENVIEKREVYPGLMTYDGYMNYARKGSNHPDYYTFARGAWPQATAEFNVTPLDFFNNSRGVFKFVGDVENVASLDPAFSDGGDKAILTTGRYGMAIGFSPSNEGVYQDFSQKPFRALQIEQQFEIQKQNTLLMAEDIIDVLHQLKVRPEWFIMDKTGNGLGLYDALRMQFGPVFGQQWSEAATDRKILEEDSMTAEERYMGVYSEMPFAFAIWLQYGYVKFAPLINPTQIVDQAIGRRYFYGGARALIKVESKREYKLRTNGISPDEYDSAIMLVHLIRMRVQQNAKMLPSDMPQSQLPPTSRRWGRIPKGVIDSPEFIEDY